MRAYTTRAPITSGPDAAAEREALCASKLLRPSTSLAFNAHAVQLQVFGGRAPVVARRHYETALRRVRPQTTTSMLEFYRRFRERR